MLSLFLRDFSLSLIYLKPNIGDLEELVSGEIRTTQMKQISIVKRHLTCIQDVAGLSH
jgi:hypothetical protein